MYVRWRGAQINAIKREREAEKAARGKINKVTMEKSVNKSTSHKLDSSDNKFNITIFYTIFLFILSASNKWSITWFNESKRQSGRN